MATANAVDNSLKKLDFIKERNDTKIVMNSFCTDARGRGTHERVATKILKLHRTIDLSSFLRVTCILHAMNRIIQSQYRKYLHSRGF